NDDKVTCSHPPASEGGAPAATARRCARVVRRKGLRRHTGRGGGAARRRLQGHAVPLLSEQGGTAEGGDPRTPVVAHRRRRGAGRPVPRVGGRSVARGVRPLVARGL